MPEARRTLAAADRAAAAVAAVSAGASGRLALGFVGSTAHGVLPVLVRALRERAPALEIALREANTAVQVDLLRRGLLDAGLVRPPIQAAGIEIEVVGSSPCGPCCPTITRSPVAARCRSMRSPASRSCSSRGRSGRDSTTRWSGSAGQPASARTSSTRAGRRRRWSRWSRPGSGSRCCRHRTQAPERALRAAQRRRLPDGARPRMGQRQRLAGRCRRACGRAAIAGGRLNNVERFVTPPRRYGRGMGGTRSVG